MSVVVVGKDKVEAAISSLAGPEMDARIGSGLVAWGQVIQRAARANLKTHHFTGRAEQSTSVSAPSMGSNTISVTVGIHGGLAPEGRPLEFGWASATGKQPPSEPIAKWLVSSSAGMSILESAGSSAVRRGQKVSTIGNVHLLTEGGRLTRRGTIASASQDSVAKGLAFVIARNIGKRGFSFGPLHWLSKASAETIEQGKAAFLRTVKR